MKILLRSLFVVLCSLTVFCINTNAQETTSILNGNIADESGKPLQGVTITVKHEPTGFVTSTQTNSKGIFIIPNLKPGGPYTVKFSYVGFKTQEIKDVQLSLGNNPEVSM
jgi:hypothetical protein